MQTLRSVWTSTVWLQSHLRPSRRGFKREEAYDEGPVLGFTQNFTQAPSIKNNLVKSNIPPGLLGQPAKTVVNLEGDSVFTLLDTGSTVSTLSQYYYEAYLSHAIPLQPMDTLLQIEWRRRRQNTTTILRIY